MSQTLSTAELCRRDHYSWIVNKYVLPNGEKYSFTGHEYLEALAKRHWEKRDHLYVMKSSQCGVSEYLISWMLWMQERNLPNWQGLGYLFPAKEQLRDHIKARVNPILEHPTFSGQVGLQNLSYIRYNNKPIYFRAGQTRKDLISWAADAGVMDEFEEYFDPIGAIDTVSARFNHSEYKWLIAVSTPKYPDIGIDAAFGLSNQHHWFVNCMVCKKEFSPLMEVMAGDIESCIVRGEDNKAGFMCPHCDELTLTNGVPGKWVQTSSGKKNRYGYAISGLFVGHQNLDDLLDKYEDAHNIQEFYNSNLGLPYSPANSRLKRKDLIELAIGEEKCHNGSKEPTMAGVDVGKKCYYQIGKATETGEISVIKYGHCSFDELPGLFARFNVQSLVIDLRPEEQSVKKLIRGKKNWYASDYNASSSIDWYEVTRADTETRSGSVKVLKNHRTQTCDALINNIAVKKRFIYPKQIRQDNVFLKQMCALQRMEKSDRDTGEIRAFYGNGGQADHLFHAGGFLLLASLLKRKTGFARQGGRFHG